MFYEKLIKIKYTYLIYTLNYFYRTKTTRNQKCIPAVAKCGTKKFNCKTETIIFIFFIPFPLEFSSYYIHKIQFMTKIYTRQEKKIMRQACVVKDIQAHSEYFNKTSAFN